MLKRETNTSFVKWPTLEEIMEMFKEHLINPLKKERKKIIEPTILPIDVSFIYFLISSMVVGLGYAAIFPGLQMLTLNDAPFERQGLAISTFFYFLI